MLFLSKVVTNYLARFFYNLTHSQNFTINILATIFLPGTILHELAHLLTAGVMLVPVGELEVVPVISENGVQLGSVQIGKTDPIRRMLIGFAPILFGVLVILGVVYVALPIVESRVVWWQILIIFYTIFVVGNTMFSSKKDAEGALGFLITILVVGVILFIVSQIFGFLSGQQIISWISAVNLGKFEAFFRIVDTYLLVPIGVDLALILLLKATQKR